LSSGLLSGPLAVADARSRATQERIICLNGPIDDSTAALVTAQLLFLESVAPQEKISLYINSPGGMVTAGLVRQQAATNQALGCSRLISSILAHLKLPPLLRLSGYP